MKRAKVKHASKSPPKNDFYLPVTKSDTVSQYYICPICNIEICDHEAESHILKCTNTIFEKPSSDERKLDIDINTNELLNVDNIDNLFGESQFSEKDVILALDDLRKYNSSTANLEYIPFENPLFVLQTFLDLLCKRAPPVVYKSKWLRLIIARLAISIYQQSKMTDCVKKCAVCQDFIKEATVSVLCWHVHCQNCWLAALGTKRLCPQCSSITDPKDLRRVYM